MNTEVFVRSGRRMARNSAKTSALLTMHLRRVCLILIASHTRMKQEGKGKEVDARRVLSQFDNYVETVLSTAEYSSWLQGVSEKVFGTIKDQVYGEFFVFNGVNPDFPKSSAKMLEQAELMMKDATDCILMLPSGTMIGLREPEEKRFEDKIWQLVAGKKPKLLIDALVGRMGIPQKPAERLQDLIKESAFSPDPNIQKEVEALIKQCTTLLVPSPETKRSWGNVPEGMSKEAAMAIQASQLRKWEQKQATAEEKFVKALDTLRGLEPLYEGFISHVNRKFAAPKEAEPELTEEQEKEVYVHALDSLVGKNVLKKDELAKHFGTAPESPELVEAMFDQEDFPSDLTIEVGQQYRREGLKMKPRKGKLQPPTA